jgi:hypothetical protein
MSETKSKFKPPPSFPSTVRTTTDQLRMVSSALVGAVFAAEIARDVADVTNESSLTLFSLTAAEFNALPPANVHPDDIVEEALRTQVAADAGWYKRYEDKWQVDRTSLRDCKQWILAVLPPDVLNLCVDDAGGEGLEQRPGYTVRDIIPRLLTAIEEQKPAELKGVKAAIEKPFNPAAETLESWLTTKRRLVTRAATHLAYQFNDMDVLLSVWSGLAPLHLGPISTFKLDWTTKNRLPAQRTFALLCTALLAWERDMADSEQVVFEPTRLSAGFKAFQTPAPQTGSTLSKLIESAQSLDADDKVIMQRYMDAALQTVAHKKSDPEFVLPPHFCTTHGMCYHESAKCNAKKSK